MKVLVADRIAASGVEFLRQQEGVTVEEAYGTPADELLAKVADVEAIIVRSETKITREVIAAAPALRAVGRAGVGVDNIDVDAATERGIIVMNTPDGNTVATAELAFTHLLCSARPVPQAHGSVVKGEWNRKAFSGAQLCEKTLGVMGLGRIGGELARRARAFRMRVLAYDPFLTNERAQSLGVEAVELDELLKQADYISLHMPATEATNKILGKEAFAKVKPGVRIVNCARGTLIDEEALADALSAGKVAAAGLDVFADEPLADDHPLRKFPQVVFTPHLGASTAEAQESVGLQVAEGIIAALRGDLVRNALNMPAVDPKALKLLAPYLRLGERLGTVLQQITPDRIETLRITYWGRIVELDAMPLTRSIQRGYLRRISGTHVNDVNAPVLMKGLGLNVEVIKSNDESDYNELIRVEAIDSDGRSWSLDGTLIGKTDRPRVVGINGREVEAHLENVLMLVENEDVPGIVGMLGSRLAEHNVNIANMALSRNAVGGLALTVLELDSQPGEAALEAIREHERIRAVHLAAVG